jgi:hypothetical protein
MAAAAGGAVGFGLATAGSLFAARLEGILVSLSTQGAPALGLGAGATVPTA